jgi:hypothetical protein
MARKTLYFLVDTETTEKNGMVFDMAFDLFDRTGRTYEYGSYLFKDVLMIEEPFFKEKIGQYWNLAFKQRVKPVSVRTARYVFNHIVGKYLRQGFKVVICAYNAAFDLSHLSLTCENLLNVKWMTPESKGVQFLDLWHGWVAGCPVEYGYTADFVHGAKAGTINPKTKKPFSWNIKTSAESVYKYIADNQHFEEKHIAHSDIIIEKVILLDILRRKKKLHIVDHPSKFVSMPWKIAQERCREPIEFRKAKQMSMAELIQPIAPVTEKKGGLQQTIFFPGDEEEG